MPARPVAIGDLIAERTAPAAPSANLDGTAACWSPTTCWGDALELEGDVPLVLLAGAHRGPFDRRPARRCACGSSRRGARRDARRGLSDAERTAGIAYWNAVWADGDTTAPWPALVAAGGRRRAPWVAEALRPTNLAARPGARRLSRTPPPRRTLRPSRARCPTGSTFASSRTAPRRSRSTATRSPTSCPSG